MKNKWCIHRKGFFILVTTNKKFKQFNFQFVFFHIHEMLHNGFNFSSLSGAERSPCCFKECLISLCSSAWHTPSPLPARQVESNNKAVKRLTSAATSCLCSGNALRFLVLSSLTGANHPGESPGLQSARQKRQREQVCGETEKKKCKKISDALRRVILSQVKGSRQLPPSRHRFPSRSSDAISFQLKAGWWGPLSSTVGPNCVLTALCIHCEQRGLLLVEKQLEMIIKSINNNDDDAWAAGVVTEAPFT